MVPFTDMSAATESIPTSAAMASMPAPTITVAPVTDENTDPSSTTNSAHSPLQKRTHPADLKPRSSPVRQRFLRETKMSLMASLPRTPTGGQKTTARAHGTPSSAKLEISRDSFYFSMDLPPTKTTPKKGPTPKKQSPARSACSTPTSAAKPELKTRIPTKQTPSPNKHRNSIQQSPKKVHSPTPTKNGKPDASSEGRPCSPVKRAIELNSPSKPVNLNLALAAKLVPYPDYVLEAPVVHAALVAKEDDYDAYAIPSTHPIPNPREFLAPVRKRQHIAKAQPEDIGQLMAKLGSDNNTTLTEQEWASWCTAEVQASPTPLHKASEKLQLKDFLSYTRLPSNSSTPASNVDARIESGGASTVIFTAPSEVQMGSNGDDDSTHSQGNLEPLADLDTAQQAKGFQYAPVHDSESASNKRQCETRVDSGKQVNCQDSDDATLEVTKTQPLDPSERVKTDFKPILKFHGDMQNAQKIKRCVDLASYGTANLTEQPFVQDEHSMIGPQKIRSQCGIGPLRRPKTTHYDTASLPRVMTGSPNRPTLSKMPRTPMVPRRLPGGSTPELMHEKVQVTAKKPDTAIAVPNKNKGPGKRHSASSIPLTKPVRSSAPASSPPNKTASTSNKQVSPNTKRTSARPKSQIFSTNPVNTKAPVISAAKHLPSKPASKPIASTPQHEPNLKFPRSILKPTPSSRKAPLQPTRSESCDASAAPRQQPNLSPISSDTDTTSRQNPTVSSKRASLVPKMNRWSKTPIKPTPVLESTTPEGSPPNPVITTPSLSPSTIPKPLPLPPQRPRTKHQAPRYLSPNPSFPVVRRARASTSPSPAPSVGHPDDEEDPNAFRAPSKTIVHSLDRAIDAKIAEDSMRGLLLLEAREKEQQQQQDDMF